MEKMSNLKFEQYWTVFIISLVAFGASILLMAISKSPFEEISRILFCLTLIIVLVFGYRVSLGKIKSFSKNSKLSQLKKSETIRHNAVEDLATLIEDGYWNIREEILDEFDLLVLSNYISITKTANKSWIIYISEENLARIESKLNVGEFVNNTLFSEGNSEKYSKILFNK